MSRYVNLGFIAAGLLCWVVFAKALGGLWALLKWNDFHIVGQKLTLTDVIGFGFAGLLVLFFWKHERLNTLANEIAQELKKVTWPTKQELKVATVVVIITVFIISAILGIFDLIWAKVTSWIY